jgi:tripartite-type tricarboxylate transporter receptor subunit TctC
LPGEGWGEDEEPKENLMRGKSSIGFWVLAILFLAGNAMAQSPAAYPTRPISIMVPSIAGGGTDVGARILAAVAEKRMGQPLVVVNKPGAGTQIGFTELSRQKPDGYYVGFVLLPAINTIILDPERKAIFNTDSFVPIINQVQDVGLIWVRAESPYKTLKDLIEDAKKRPGQIRVSTTGILSDDHLAILMMEQAAGVKFRIVHFDGGPQQLTATLGGQVDVSFDNVGGVALKIRGGPVRGLAVMDRERSKFLPEIPTTSELGYPTVISSSTRGVMGPRGIPGPIIKKIQEVFLDAMKNTEHMDKMDKAALGVKPMVGEEYAKFFRDMHERCKPLVEAVVKAR